MRFCLVFVSLLACLLGCAVDVDAHAKLVSPMPWNPQPTKQQVCGVSAAAAIPTRYVVSQVDPNNPLIVQWQVVIADGRGPLTARLDTTAKVNPTLADFTVTLPPTPGKLNNPQKVSNIPYQISFQIPAGTTCTGAGGICTLRVASSSGWVACATIKLMGVASATATPTLAPTAAPTDAPIPVDQTSMPVPTTPAPSFPTPQGSNGAGGALGARRVLATQSKSGLEFMINAAAPQVAGRPQGVIMFLHGSTASNYANGLRMFAKVAQQYDFIQLSVLAPNGQGWNEGGSAAQVTAAHMLNNLIQLDLKPAYNIDLAKIFLTGQSSGGGFLSQFFIPLHAKDIAGGAFFQCGAAPPAVQFQPTAAIQANVKLHFEITTGDPIWPQSYAAAIRAYTATGMSFTMLNTKPGGHCAFDQQQVVLDRLPAMLPKATNTAAAAFATQDATGDLLTVFAAEASPKTRCVVAQGLTACPKVNGQSVQLLTTSDLMMVDMAAENAITSGLNNNEIITTTPSSDCQQAYRDMMCATYFTPCGSSFTTTCQASCQLANQVCSFNQTVIDDFSHASMYDCTKPTYQQLYADANGMCAGAPGALPGGDLNGAMSYASPMMIVTLLISMIAMLFH